MRHGCSALDVTLSRQHGGLVRIFRLGDPLVLQASTSSASAKHARGWRMMNHLKRCRGYRSRLDSLISGDACSAGGFLLGVHGGVDVAGICCRGRVDRGLSGRLTPPGAVAGSWA